MQDELVLVVDYYKIASLLGTPEPTLNLNHKNEFIKIISKEHYFVERETAERDISFKQIIPYAIITFNESYLLFRRLHKQRETRLHNKYSLGIGGHINPVNTTNSILLSGLMRELNEEIQIDVKEINLIGVLNDDTTNVGKHHLGLLYKIDIKSSEYRIMEKDKMEGRWVVIEEILEIYDKYIII